MSKTRKKKSPPLVKPQVPKRKYISKSKKIKIATNNLFLNNVDPAKVSQMESVILQDMGAQELITISRHDLLTGQNVEYNIIRDLASAYIQYNPNTLIKLQGTDQEISSEFTYNFGRYVPEVGTGVDITNQPDGSIVYYDPSNGEVVINTINITSNQFVEIQFLTYDDIINDTIYP